MSQDDPNQDRHKAGNGFELAREWFTRWAATLHATPWSPDVPSDAEFELGQLINRATSAAYAAGTRSVQELHEKIRTAGDAAAGKTTESKGR